MERAVEKSGLVHDLDAIRIGASGRRGNLGGRISFPPYPGYLIAISEVIDIDRGPDPRVKYTYQLFRPDGSIWGYHRDPRKPPELRDHFHPDARTRLPRTVSIHMAEMLEHAWSDVVSFHTPPRGR